MLLGSKSEGRYRYDSFNTNDIYPALGGDYPGNFALDSTKALDTNVTGITVPLSGHWIPEEQPQFVIEQLAKFFTE